MQDLGHKLVNLKIYWNGIWARKRYILVIMWLVCLTGWSLISLMPNQYETKAKVYADTRSILRPLLSGLAVQEDTEQEVQVTSRTLLSRDILESIARGTDLHLQYPDPADYENMLQKLKEQIEITGSVKNNVYDIRYQHTDPKMAMRVVELTLRKFVDASAGRSRDDSASATNFLDTQISVYRERLEKSDAELAKFKRENQNYLPGTGSGYYTNLSQLNKELEALSQQINEKNAELNGFRNRFVPTGTTDGVAVALPSVNTEFDKLLSDMRSALEQLQINYTDKHPNIIELKNRISVIEKMQASSRTELIAQASQGAMTPAPDGENQALQQFAFKISELESQRDVLMTRKSSMEEKLAELHKKLDLIPSIEAKLIDLQRNYDNDNRYYQELVKRRDSAEISKNADANTQDVKFKVLDEPRVATKPVGPPRILLHVMTFIAGLSLGVLAAFMASRINATVSGAIHLQTMIGRAKIIGIIPHLNNQAANRTQRIKVLVFMASMFVLMSMLAVLVGHEIVYGESPIKWLKLLSQ